MMLSLLLMLSLTEYFLIFGPPMSLIVDEDRALSSKVMHYVLDTLKIDVKCISPYNHGSLKNRKIYSNNKQSDHQTP